MFKINKAKYKRAIGRNKKLSAEKYNGIYSDDGLIVGKNQKLRNEYKSSRKYNF